MNHLTNEQISKIRRLLTDLTTHEHRESSYLRAYYLCAYKALHLSRGLYKSHLFMQNKANLLDAQMNVTSVLTKDYERNDIFAVPENKANSNPIKPNLPDAQMSVNSILTKDYERNDIFAVPENKANSNPIKPNLPNSQPKSTQKLKNPQYRAIKKPRTGLRPRISYLVNRISNIVSQISYLVSREAYLAQMKKALLQEQGFNIKQQLRCGPHKKYCP